MILTGTLGWVAVAAFGAAVWVTVYALSLRDAPERPHLGLRGLKRRQGVSGGSLFGLVEPIVRVVGGWLSYLPMPGIRRRVDHSLRQSGDWLGLDANELFALCIVSTLGMLGLGVAGVALLDLPEVVLFFFGGLGPVLPYLRLTGEVQRRRKQITRALPAAIDLGALCMGAGLSFAASIEQIVSKSGRQSDALNEELKLILHQLQIGVTRRRALENLAERVPTDAVKGFVGAVVQSEEKGTPLAEVLRVQAETLRLRRSVSGEEAASRAAVLMMIPLMLILCATILVLMGPFLIRGTGSFF